MRRWILVLTAAFTANLARSAPHDAEKVVVEIEGETTTLEAGDLAEGEVRTFDHGGQTVTVTRSGGSLSVEVTGEAPEASTQKKVVVVRGGDHEGAAGDKKVFVWSAKLDGDADTAMTEGLGEPGAEVFTMMDGKTLFRCTENQVEVRIPKDLVPKDGVPCPIGGGPTEEVKPGARTFMYKFHTDDGANPSKK